jgi:hypothetical protein
LVSFDSNLVLARGTLFAGVEYAVYALAYTLWRTRQ